MGKENIRLLIVSSSNFFSTYGGGQVYVKNLIDELVIQGFSPVIASPANKNGYDEIYNGCRLITFKLPLKVMDAVQILQKIKPEVAHVHGFKAQFVQACKDQNIPCIITAHHGGILCPAGALLNHRNEICHLQANQKDCLPCVLKNIRGGFYAWPVLRLIPIKLRLALGRFMKKLPFILYISPILEAALSIQLRADEWETIYENASLIIAPSYAIADSMIRNRALTEKIKVLPHGIPLPDLSLYYELKAGKEATPLKFFYVGRICYVKGVHIMLAVFDKLSPDAELHIIGGAGNKTEKRYLNRLQKKYRHNRQIIWEGKLEPNEVNKMISLFDVMIHPAIYLEIFGLNIAEALAMRKSVIATRCGGAEMQVEDGLNGWLVEPNSAYALGVIIHRLIRNPELLLNFPKDRLIHIHSIEAHVHELMNLYEESII